MSETRVVVPDIGDVESVDVIELLVSPGSAVTKEQGLIGPVFFGGGGIRLRRSPPRLVGETAANQPNSRQGDGSHSA